MPGASEKRIERIGIYGGTFNPPHLGHRAAAEAFLSQLSLDRLLVIPTFLPPHKNILSPVSESDRLEMTKLAFRDLEKTEVSDREIRRGGKSYTYLTLEELSGEGRKLFLLVGTDMFLSMNEWKYPERIFSSAALVCARRENEIHSEAEILSKKSEYEEKYGAEIHLLRNQVIEISSTELREAIRSGNRTAGMLAPQVMEYIRRKRLYETEKQ